jgi:colanic acid/amylovoran biosynthesis glycosyltransferase
MVDLLPGRTVAVARSARGDGCGAWTVDCPMLVLDELSGAWGGRMRRVARKMGMPVADNSLRAVERFLKKHKVQVFLGEYMDQSLKWLPVVQELGIRFFVHAHGYDVSLTLRDPEWRRQYLAYNHCGGIITVSEVSKMRLVNMGIAESKVHVIPCGVDVPAEAKEKASNECVRCLAVGRMSAKKAPILVLDAFRRALETFPRMYLDYVGAGELLPAVRQFIRAFNLGERVTLHGGRPHGDVQRLMNEADVFVQHSVADPETGDEEGLPVAILEAMAKSLPVVSTRHAGIPEAVVDGSTGYLVDEWDSVAMGEKIAILARDPGRRRHLGIAGWEHAKKHFTWDRERADLLRTLGLESEG